MNDNRKPTDDLIRGLAAQAGKGSSLLLRLSIVLPVALVFSILAATGVVVMIAGPRSDLMQVLPTWTFLFKVIGMVLVAAGGFQLVLTVVQPGQAPRTVLFLAPALMFLLTGALFDRSGFPAWGSHLLRAKMCGYYHHGFHPGARRYFFCDASRNAHAPQPGWRFCRFPCRFRGWSRLYHRLPQRWRCLCGGMVFDRHCMCNGTGSVNRAQTVEVVARSVW